MTISAAPANKAAQRTHSAPLVADIGRSRRPILPTRMLRSIDSKSLIVGGLLVFSVACLIGGAPYIAPEYHSRFQIATNPNYAFVLDSATGQVWSKYFPPEPPTVIGDTDAFHDQKLFEDEIPGGVVSPQQ